MVEIVSKAANKDVTAKAAVDKEETTRDTTGTESTENSVSANEEDEKKEIE